MTDEPMTVAEVDAPTCPMCKGQGWYADHADECVTAGECVGCGGVRTRCPRGCPLVPSEATEGP